MSSLNEIKTKATQFNLLYVEDEQLVRQKLYKYFSGFFKNVYCAKDGLEAFAAFNKHHIDLVITDVNMPRMNGLELSKEIKEINKETPIVLITANTDVSCFINAIEIGIDKFLVKPINRDKLVDILNDVLKVLENKRKKEELELRNYDLSCKLEIKTKELNMFKDDMIAVFTHELKTPLHAIINFSDYIHNNMSENLQTRKIQKIKELSQKIHSNAMFQSSLIETLLDVTKYKAGKMVLKEIPLVANELILSVVHRYQSLYNKKISIDLDEFDIVWDRKAFLMIVENIYSNALKYSKSRIHMSLKKLDSKHFFLCIEDDGKGIEEKMRDVIFSQFEQLEEAYLDRKKSGTGLGLYLVKLILDKCNANVEVSKSALLGGARFYIKGSINND